MDDKTKGIGDEMTRARGGDSPRRRSPTSAVSPRARDWSDEPSSRSTHATARERGATERVDQIRSEIEQTRDEMSGTIDEIQERVRPSTVAANAAASVRDTASRAASTVRSAASETVEDVAESRVGQQLRANPLPAAMIGIGLVGAAWLALGGRNGAPPARRFTTPLSPAATVPAGETGESAAERARELAARTTEYTRQAARKAQQNTRRVQSQLQRAITENPLLAGAAALAAGALVGMALPETEQEDEWLGEARDNVVEEAQELARNAVARVQETATDAAKRVQDVITDPVTLLSKNE